MKETSEKVFPLILKHVEKLREINPDLYTILMFFIEKRKDKPLLKPFLVRLSYEICGGKDWEKVIPICAVFELLNISSYQANISFDDKCGILSQPEKNSQFIASMITRELCFEILEEARNVLGEEIIYKINQSISRSNKYIYIAQHYDLNVLSIKNLEKYLNNEKLYIDDYIKRCYYGSGIFNGECAYIGGLLVGANQKLLNALRNFGENYGIGLQIMNDLADFVPPGIDGIINRLFQDQFSDIKNGRLTLAFYQILRVKGKEFNWIVRKIEAKEKFSDLEMKKIIYTLMENKIVTFIKSLSARYAKNAKKYLSAFPNNNIKSSLSLMCTICYENKYLKAIKNYVNM